MNLQEFLAFGSPAFWVTSLIINGLLILFTEKRYHFWSLILLTAAIGWFWQPLNISTGMLTLKSFYGALIYIAIGAAYSLVRWWVFAKDKVEECKIRMASFPITSNETDELLKRKREIGALLNPKLHKDQIISWMVYWPWSLTWNLLWNVTARLWYRIYYMLFDLYATIAEKAIGHYTLK